jgi:hypothetical protein
MPYHIDLTSIPIDRYKDKLKTAYLPPSRQMLLDNLDERFNLFKKVGITKVSELLTLLKRKDKVAELSKHDCFKGDYLTILLRELNSMLPKPNKISDFKGISQETIQKLEAIGISNTLKLYPRILTQNNRIELSESTAIPINKIVELAKLADLSRIKWVGATFARMLYDLGIDSVGKAAKANPEILHKQLNDLNAKMNYFKGYIGLNDIRILVQTAGEVPVEVEI